MPTLERTRRLSLKQKLILLPVITVALSLFAGGVALTLVVDRLYVSLSQQSLDRAASVLEQQVMALGNRLLGDVRLLSKREELIAVASMVSTYQRSDVYQPLVFDLEKQRLAVDLASRLILSGHDLVSVCDANGELIAAAHRSEEGMRLFALSFEAGEPKLLSLQEGVWRHQPDWPKELAGCHLKTGLQMVSDDEGFVLRASEPLARTLPNGARQVVGRILLSNLYDTGQLASMIAQEGVGLARVTSDGSLKGTFTYPLPEEIKEQTLMAQSRELFRTDHYFLTTVLVGENAGTVRFALGLNSTLYQEQRRSTLMILMVVLLLAAVAVIPVATFLANRSVLRPVEQLVSNMESIKAGTYQNLQADDSKDEIGRLARAFDAMAKAVWQREWELQEYRDHLEQKVEEEVSKRQEQEKILIRQSRLAAMGEALSSIAHHWRQPLNALGANIQDLPDAHAHGELDAAYLKRVSESSMRLIGQMSQTIDAFRNFFRPDAEKEPFSVVQAIERTLKMLTPTLENSKVTISTDFRSDPVVEGYPNEFAQVILHLLTNAVDAMIERQSTTRNISITVSTTAEQKARIEVFDTAGGVDQMLVSRLFEPYVSTKQKSHGSGVGLYMAKMIVEWNMKGSITFANRDGGACFTIEV